MKLTTDQIISLCKSYSVMMMFGHSEQAARKRVEKEYEEMLKKKRS